VEFTLQETNAVPVVDVDQLKSRNPKEVQQIVAHSANEITSATERHCRTA